MQPYLLLLIFGASLSRAFRSAERSGRVIEWNQGQLDGERIVKLNDALKYSIQISLSSNWSHQVDFTRGVLEKASPFTKCMSYFAQVERAMTELQLGAEKALATSKNPFGLRHIGQVATGGEMFALKDERFIVKRISEGEAASLANLVETNLVSIVYGGCKAFATTLLSPALLSFELESDFYILTMNRTAEFSQRGDFVVSGVYNVKPLPNESPGLHNFLAQLLHGWGEQLCPLSMWPQWTTLKDMLERDLTLLGASSLFDFSLSIHLLTSNSLVQGLASTDMSLGEKGCIGSHHAEALLCVDIIDYLVPFDIRRQIQNVLEQPGKFDTFPKRVSTAFDCFGDLGKPSCSFYYDYIRVHSYKDTMLQARFNALFVGTASFLYSYNCTSRMAFLSALLHKVKLSTLGGANELLFKIAKGDPQFVSQPEDLQSIGRLSPTCRNLVLEEAARTQDDQQNIILSHASDSILVVGPSAGLSSRAVDTSQCNMPLGSFTCKLSISDPFQFDYLRPLDSELSILVVHAPNLFAH